MSEAHDMVREFHEAFGLPVGISSPTDPKRLQLRSSLIGEEGRETLMATLDVEVLGPTPQRCAEVLDGLADLVYVCHGFAIEFGWDLDEALRRVHASNMSKLGPDGKPVYRADGKVLKGDGFKPPMLEDLVQ